MGNPFEGLPPQGQVCSVCKGIKKLVIKYALNAREQTKYLKDNKVASFNDCHLY